MYKKVIATWVAVLAVFVGAVSAFSAVVRADDPKMKEMHFLGTMDLASKTDNVYYRVFEDGIYLDKEEVSENEDWNFAYYPKECKAEFRNLNVEGKVTSTSFFYACAENCDPVEIIFDGKNSLHIIENEGAQPFTGINLVFKGKNGRDKDFLDLKVSKSSETPVISTHEGLTITNMTLSIEQSFETESSNELSVIQATEDFFAGNASINIKVDDAKGRGIRGIFCAPENNLFPYQELILEESSLNFEINKVGHPSAGILIYNSAAIDERSEITGVITGSKTADYSDLYGIFAKRQGSVKEASLQIMGAKIDMTIGSTESSSDSSKAASLQGIYADDYVHISGSDIDLTIGGAANRRTGLEAEHLSIVDSDVCLDLTTETDDTLTAGIFSYRSCTCEGECELDIKVPFLPKGGGTSTALRCYGKEGYSSSGVVFHAIMTGNSVYNLGGEGMPVDNSLSNGKQYIFEVQDHSELTLSCEGGIVVHDGIKVDLSTKPGKDGIPFKIYQGNSSDSANLVDSVSDIDWASKYVHVDAHVYSDCDDTECDICGRTREALQHEFADTDFCHKCGYIRNVEITDLDEPVVGRMADNKIICSLGADIATATLSWSPAERIEHNKTYTATIKVTPKDGYFFKNTATVKTAASLNGSAVSYKIDGTGALIITKSFKTPAPTPKVTITVTPTVTPIPLPPTPTIAAAKMPDVVGMNYEEAKTEIVDQLRAGGLYCEIEFQIAWVHNNDPEKSFTVVQQNPEAGRMIWGNTKLVVELYVAEQGITPTPVTPTPVTPTPVTPTPVTPTPGEPTPVTPTPGEPTPVTPTPGEPTPDPEKEPSIADFVERLYTIALNRDSEPEGKAFWVNEIESGNRTGGDCAHFFLIEAPEFLNRGLNEEDFVETLYLTFFDRASEAAGKKFWVDGLKSGKLTKENVIMGFIDSTEWCNVCATYGVKSGAPHAKAEFASKNAIKFATRLYTECLGREPEEGGLKYWSLALTNLEQTGCSAAKNFFTSAEFVGFKLKDEEYVRRLYTTFMGRNPEASEVAYWAGEIKAGRQTKESVMAFFGQSEEFTKICKLYGIDRGTI